MIPNHKWVKPKEFIAQNEADTPCYINIEGKIYKAFVDEDGLGFYVYLSDNHMTCRTFFMVSHPLIHGVTIDDGQGVPELR